MIDFVVDIWLLIVYLYVIYLSELQKTSLSFGTYTNTTQSIFKCVNIVVIILKQILQKCLDISQYIIFSRIFLLVSYLRKYVFVEKGQTLMQRGFIGAHS